MRVSNFDERTFRNALGNFATGVAIVTSITDAGERHGLTVSSFNAVSLTPPLVLFSLRNKADGFAAWKNARRYVINILGEEQRDLSDRFGRPYGGKWRDLDAEEIEGGFIFRDSLLALECESYRQYEGGDHEILVGLVTALHDLRPANPHPLIFHRGRYNQIERCSGSEPLQDAFFW